MALGRVACLGDNCIDEYVPPVALAAVGGSALNVAVALRRLGHEAAYLGAVGDDAAGRRIAAALAAEAIDAGRLRSVPGGGTAVTQIELRQDGDRVFLDEDFGVGAAYDPSAGDLAAIAGAAHAHLGITGLADYRRTAATLARAGLPVSCDFRDDHAADDLSDFAIAFYSAPAAAAEALAAHSLAAGAAAAVVTCGLDGSYASDGRDSRWAAAEPAESVVDTCGAGDSYTATFIHRRLAGASLADAMRAAAGAAAATCTHIGAFEQELVALNGAGT